MSDETTKLIEPEVTINPSQDSIIEPEVLVGESTIVTKSNPEPVVEMQVTNPVVSSGTPEVLYGTVPEQIEAEPLSAPIDSAPTLEPTSVGDVAEGTEPAGEVQRPYSLDPKLNKMIEGFVRGMNNSKENLILANRAVKAKMMKKVYKIMDLFERSHARTPIGNRIGVGEQSIKNDDVEKLLHVSDNTATKYLNILVKEGKVKKEGNSHSPSYKKL